MKLFYIIAAIVIMFLIVTIMAMAALGFYAVFIVDYDPRYANDMVTRTSIAGTNRAVVTLVSATEAAQQSQQQMTIMPTK